MVGLLVNFSGRWERGAGFADLASALGFDPEVLMEAVTGEIASPSGGREEWIRVVRADGEERYLRHLPIPSEEKKGLSYALWDETEAALKQAALHRERDRFEALVDLSSEGFSIFNEEAVVVYDSRTNERIHGYPPEAVVGHNILEFIHPEDAPQALEQFQRLLGEPGGVDSAVVRWRHVKGHWIFLEGTVINLLHEPRVQGLINNFRDIGPRLQIEEALRESRDKAELSERIQRRFLTNLTHELRTPFALIKQPLVDLQEQAPPELAHHQHWGIIERNIERLDGLLSELIDLSHLELAEMPLEVSAMDLAGWLGQWREEVAEGMRQKDLVWRWEVEPVEEVFLDVRKIAKVVLNLFSNAIKFSPVKGEIVVRLRRDPGDSGCGDGWLVLEVEDEGNGVPAKERTRIFERFYQVGGGIGRPAEGMGIGLALVRELVDLHGGDIVCLEGAKGGARLRVSLPMGTAHYQPEDILLIDAPVGGVRKLPDGGGGFSLAKDGAPEREERNGDAEEEKNPLPALPTLLLVEDNYDMRAFLRSHLVKRFRVVEQDSGEAALAYLESGERPGLILLDVMMPGLDGLSVCREVRKIWSKEALPVVLLSAKSGHDDRIEGLAAGANDYLGKPFLVRELLNRLETLVPVKGEGGAERKALEEKFRDLVLAHMGESTFSLAWLAKKMGMSLRSLQRLGQEVWRKAPGEMVNEFRLEKAKEMMANGMQGTIAEVAHAVGLSPNYFARLFRSQTGLTPAEFRARHGQVLGG